MFLVFGRSIGMQLAKMPFAIATDAMADIQRVLSLKMQFLPNGDILKEAIYQSDIF